MAYTLPVTMYSPMPYTFPVTSPPMQVWNGPLHYQSCATLHMTDWRKGRQDVSTFHQVRSDKGACGKVKAKTTEEVLDRRNRVVVTVKMLEPRCLRGCRRRCVEMWTAVWSGTSLPRVRPSTRGK